MSRVDDERPPSVQPRGLRSSAHTRDDRTTYDVRPSAVQGVTVHRFPEASDLRGNLTVGTFGEQVPFAPKRFFMVHGVPEAEVRGEHAHRACAQFLVCTRGACTLVVDDGRASEELRLDAPSIGVHIPPMIWGIQRAYTHDAVLLVFASHPYDADDYIRRYADFVAEVTRSV